MLMGEQLSEQVYETAHIASVLDAIQHNFPKYFSKLQDSKQLFDDAIKVHEKEYPAYQNYLDLEALDEFEADPNAFKRETRANCPIIRRCLMSQDEIMKSYKVSFAGVDGQDLLHTIYNVAVFGQEYSESFDHRKHESSKSYKTLGLTELADETYSCIGVVGYGIQSTLLYSLYPHAFAHRSQNAVWSLFFLSGRQDFGLGEEGSEFLMVRPQYGTCEQNYFYPPELFGYYALQVYRMLKDADPSLKKMFNREYRYTYLDVFFDHVANIHREDINALKWTSEHVENHWH